MGVSHTNTIHQSTQQTDRIKQLHLLLGRKPNRPFQLATRRLPSGHWHLRLASHHCPRHRQTHHRRGRDRERLCRRYLAYWVLCRFAVCLGGERAVCCACAADYFEFGLVRCSELVSWSRAGRLRYATILTVTTLQDWRAMCSERPRSDFPKLPEYEEPLSG